MGHQTHYGICNLCDAACGLEIVHDGRAIRSIRGDRLDPFSRGHVCPKGVAQKELFEDPDRLRHPVRRVGQRWEPIGWDEALETISERVVALERERGRQALGLYFGNPAAHNHRTLLALVALALGAGTRNLFTSNSLDSHPRTLVSYLLYGNQALVPIPDLERTEHLVVMGANPMVSHGSAMATPDTRKRLRALRARGGKLVVIDPRFTETAREADEHLYIRPGTDAALLFAVLHVLHAEGRLRPWRGDRRLRQLDELVELLVELSPERVADFVGIEAAAIRRLALELSEARSAVWYGRMGTCTQSFGCLTTWLIDLVNILTGNFDRPGGAMFTTPAVDLARIARLLGQRGGYGRWHSRVRKLPEIGGELPVATLADEIETPGEGQIRGLLGFAGNPVLSSPNGARLDRALEQLELFVAVDFYINETTRHAHFVLPAATVFESAHYPLLEAATAIRNVARYAPQMLPPEPGVRPDSEIALALAAGIMRKRGAAGRLLASAIGAYHSLLSSEKVLDWLLRTGPHRLSMRELRANPHGMDLGPLEPRIERVLATHDGKIGLVPAVLRADIARLRAAIDAGPARPGDELSLISQRTLNSMNSWLHNLPGLTAGRNRCVLTMHSRDARARGLASGQIVRVTSRTGSIEVTLRVEDSVMPGVVALPFGWDRTREGTRLTVAKRSGGPSFNDVSDERDLDAVSSTVVLDGIPVQVGAVFEQ